MVAAAKGTPPEPLSQNASKKRTHAEMSKSETALKAAEPAKVSSKKLRRNCETQQEALLPNSTTDAAMLEETKTKVAAPPSKSCTKRKEAEVTSDQPPLEVSVLPMKAAADLRSLQSADFDPIADAPHHSG